MKTYISKNKFQFITDYSKHSFRNTNDEIYELDFNSLSIEERIMLSAYLTALCNESKTGRESLYDIIFNFNNKKKYHKTSYHDAFIEDLSKLLKEKPYYFVFLKDNFAKIENDKTFIYRQQLNSAEMEVLYTMKFQRSYKSMLKVLYIIGVAKQNIVTTALNHISLDKFYSNNSTLAKKTAKEIFEKLSKACGRTIEYKIVEKDVWFKNGFEIEEKKEFYSEDKKSFDKQKHFEEWLNSSNQPEQNKIEVKPAKKQEKQPVNEILEDPVVLSDLKNTEIVSPFDLGDHHLDKEIIRNYIEENSFDIQNWIPDKKASIAIRHFAETKLYKEFLKKLISDSSSDIYKVYHGEFLTGEAGLDKRNEALAEIEKIQNKTISALDKAYDVDKDHYSIIFKYICKTFSNLFIKF